MAEGQVLFFAAYTEREEDVRIIGTCLSDSVSRVCHHLDFHRFGCHDSWHTRGFYEL